MTSAVTKNFVLLLVLALIVVTTIFLLTKPLPGDRTHLDGVSQRFMRVLPDDLREEQVDEIKGLLARFDTGIKAGSVDPADRDEVRGDMQRYIAAGTIARKDLNTLMAKVGYYTMRLNPEMQHLDGSGIHPLLEKEKTDTTTTDRDG